MIYNIHMYTYFSAIFKCVPYLLLLSYTESLFNDYSHLIIHQQEWLTLTRSRIISILVDRHGFAYSRSYSEPTWSFSEHCGHVSWGLSSGGIAKTC